MLKKQNNNLRKKQVIINILLTLVTHKSCVMCVLSGKLLSLV